MTRWCGIATVAVVLLACPARAEAHAIGVSSGQYRFDGALLHAYLTLARDDAASLFPALAADGDGALTADPTQPFLPEMAVTTPAGACRPLPVHLVPVAADGVQVTADWTCPPGQVATLTLAWLDRLPQGHRHLPSLAVGAHGQPGLLAPLYRGHAALEVPAHAIVQVAWSQRAAAFIALGIEHILTGADHLLFLLGLLLLGGSVRTLLGIVTSFTAAHSLSLGLAVLGVWVPAPRIIEPLIAASIAWIGVENLWRRNPSGRWRIAMPFGLIHGFGLASALRGVSTAPADIPLALASFNAGVELGQLAVLAIALPLLASARRRGWLAAGRLRVLNAGLVTAGACWCVARLAG